MDELRPKTLREGRRAMKHSIYFTGMIAMILFAAPTLGDDRLPESAPRPIQQDQKGEKAQYNPWEVVAVEDARAIKEVAGAEKGSADFIKSVDPRIKRKIVLMIEQEAPLTAIGDYLDGEGVSPEKGISNEIRAQLVSEVLLEKRIELLDSIKKLQGGEGLADELGKVVSGEKELIISRSYVKGKIEGIDEGFTTGLEYGHKKGFYNGYDAGREDGLDKGFCSGFINGTDLLIDSMATNLNRNDFIIVKQKEGTCNPAETKKLPNGNKETTLMLPSFTIVMVRSGSRNSDTTFDASHLSASSASNGIFSAQSQQSVYQNPYLQNPPEDVNLQLRQEYYQRLLVDQVRQLNTQLYMQSLPSTTAPPSIQTVPRFQRP